MGCFLLITFWRCVCLFGEGGQGHPWNATARKVTLICGILTTDFLIVLLNFPSTLTWLDLFFFWCVCIWTNFFVTEQLQINRTSSSSAEEFLSHAPLLPTYAYVTTRKDITRSATSDMFLGVRKYIYIYTSWPTTSASGDKSTSRGRSVVVLQHLLAIL